MKSLFIFSLVLVAVLAMLDDTRHCPCKAEDEKKTEQENQLKSQIESAAKEAFPELENIQQTLMSYIEKLKDDVDTNMKDFYIDRCNELIIHKNEEDCRVIFETLNNQIKETLNQMKRYLLEQYETKKNEVDALKTQLAALNAEGAAQEEVAAVERKLHTCEEEAAKFQAEFPLLTDAQFDAFIEQLTEKEMTENEMTEKEMTGIDVEPLNKQLVALKEGVALSTKAKEGIDTLIYQLGALRRQLGALRGQRAAQDPFAAVERKFLACKWKVAKLQAEVALLTKNTFIHKAKIHTFVFFAKRCTIYDPVLSTSEMSELTKRIEFYEKERQIVINYESVKEEALMWMKEQLWCMMPYVFKWPEQMREEYFEDPGVKGIQCQTI